MVFVWDFFDNKIKIKLNNVGKIIVNFILILLIKSIIEIKGKNRVILLDLGIVWFIVCLIFLMLDMIVWDKFDKLCFEK